MTITIRPAQHDDAHDIMDIAVDSNMFLPEELTGVGEMLDTWLDNAAEPGHEWIVLDDNGTIKGAAYYAIETMADNVWNVFFIAVKAEQRRCGVASQMITFIEQAVKDRGGRIVLIETSSNAQFEPARQCYLKLNFTHEGTIRQFYGDTEDKMVFWKSLAG